tara:strand:+ start:739 stop:2280 length:1542 start_codon:yes stop_codon:yes gene_type:complete
MKHFNKKIFIFIIFTNFLISDPSFYIDKTEVIGFTTKNNIDVYLGIPYAEAPVNELRWQATAPKVFAEDKYYAKNFSSACMQGPRIVNWYKGVALGFGGNPEYIEYPKISEDCLYLNMWVPKNSSHKDKIPVLVYIHGGSNRAGWSFEPNYLGENLASNGIIVITVSYRLGVFGFFSHPELEISNFALLDLIESLKWIKSNISKVGGDPNNITISGESAGATNVAHLMVSPLSKDLFNKAIHQSAGWSVIKEDIDYQIPKQLAEKLSVELLDKNRSINNIHELRKIEATKLLNKAEEVYGYIGYYPDIDNFTIFEPIYNSFNSGNFNHVDLIIGTNSDEELMYLDSNYFLSDFYNERENLGFYVETKVIDSLVDNIKEDKQKINFLLTARNWTCPSSFIASSINKHTKKNVWFYSFDRVRDGRKSNEMGAYHGAELPYIFNTHDKWLPTSSKDIKITKIIQEAWTNFIIKGDPNNHNIKWNKFNYNEFNVLSFNDETLMKKSDAYDVCMNLGY